MNPKTIRDIVEARTGLDISGPCRESNYSDARTVYAVISRKYLYGCSLREIGEEIDRDHSTVVHLTTMSHAKRTYRSEYKKLYSYVDAIVKPIAELEKERDRGKSIDAILDEEAIRYNELLDDQRIKLVELKAEYDRLRDQLNDPLIVEIASLPEHQLTVFKERATIMLKSVKSIRTYGNTSKANFNPAPEKLKINQISIG